MNDVGRGLLRAHRAEAIARATGKYPPGKQAAAALELLFEAQEEYGWLTEDAIAEVAEIVSVPPTHIHALVGFYTLLYSEPHGRYVVHYCTDLPCALAGAAQLLPVVVEKLGCRVGQTSADGMFSLHEAMCLAACDRAPMMQVDLEYFESLTPERIDAIVTDLRAQANGAVPAGANAEIAVPAPADANAEPAPPATRTARARRKGGTS